MIKHIISDGASTYTRISKNEARKRFDAGKDFALCPVKLRPGFPWAPHMTVRSGEHKANGRTFEQLLNEFCYYNANCNETGLYAAFYLVTEKGKTTK